MKSIFLKTRLTASFSAGKTLFHIGVAGGRDRGGRKAVDCCGAIL
jgi:hypothetical protein